MSVACKPPTTSRTAVLTALFTDAMLPDHMVGRYGFTAADQHEWHGNTFSVEQGEEPLGSNLFILRRAPLNHETARLAEHYAAEALQPLVRQGRVVGFDIRSEVDHPHGRINIYIRTLGQPERFFAADLFPLR